MGRACVLFVVAMLPAGVALVPAPRVRAADPAPLKIGMPESMFSGLPAAVVQVGAKPFKEMFEKQTGLKGEVSVIKDYADATAQLRGDKLDVAVFHGFEYAWVRQHPELVPLLVAVPGTKIQACLVVNVKSKATGPEDLKGACVVVPNATKAHCTLYLDRLKEKLPSGCCGAKTDNKSIEEALDGVATDTAEAVLIDVGTLDGYKRNKPAVGEQIKILDRSPQFPSAAIVYRKNAFTATTEKSVREGLMKSVESPQGQMLKGIWKLKGFSEVDKAYQTDLDECLKAYPAPKQK